LARELKKLYVAISISENIIVTLNTVISAGIMKVCIETHHSQVDSDINCNQEQFMLGLLPLISYTIHHSMHGNKSIIYFKKS